MTAAIPGVQVSEVGSTSGETFTVTVSDTKGTLSASCTGVSGSGTAKLTIAGTLAQVNGALASLTYLPVGLASDAITISVKDSLGGGAGPASVSILTPVYVVNAGAAQSYPFGGSAVAVMPSATVSDAQSATIKSATIKIQNGFISGDLLAFPTHTATV